MSVFKFGDQGAFRRRGRRQRRPIPAAQPSEEPSTALIHSMHTPAPNPARGHFPVFALSWSVALFCVALTIAAAAITTKASFGPLYSLLMLPVGLGAFAFPFWRVRQWRRFRDVLTEGDAPLLENELTTSQPDNQCAARAAGALSAGS